MVRYPRTNSRIDFLNSRMDGVGTLEWVKIVVGVRNTRRNPRMDRIRNHRRNPRMRGLNPRMDENFSWGSEHSKEPPE